jgi:chemotaxis signal transduction protein
MSESDSTASSQRTEAPDWLGMARSASTALDPTAGDGETDMLRELLVIALNGDPYAIAVERVREIVRMRSLTRIPRAPEWLLGALALRGEVVEVIDLRCRLGLVAREPDRSSRIIVLHGDDDRVAGVLVDTVRDVHRVSEDEIQMAEDFDFSAVVEMCQRDGEFISILDIDRALGFSDA